MASRFKRILLKLSGEALMGDQGFGICPTMLAYVAEEVRSIVDLDVQLAIVVGGGNIFRGVAAGSFGMERTSADHMGMLATVLNSLALQDALEKRDIQTRVQTAISMHEVAEPYILRRALPTRQRFCAPRRFTQRFSSKPPRSTGYLTPIPNAMSTLGSLKPSAIWKYSKGNCA